jgi:PAS domain S-box-containing protein
MPQGDLQTSGKGRKIVYAENDRLLREAIKDILEAKGFEVHLAADGLEALLAIRSVRPDVAILDIVMPRLDGGRVCWLIRQDPQLRNTPVIAFSGLGAKDFRQFPELSADAYVAKGPLAKTVQNLIQAIEYVEQKERLEGEFSGGLFGYEGVYSRQMVKEMLLEKHHHANLLRSLGAGVIEFDQVGRILMANSGACEILGNKEPLLVGQRLVALCAESDRATLDAALVRLADSKEPEEVREELRFGERLVALRLSSVIDNEVCTSILGILERPKPASKSS